MNKYTLYEMTLAEIFELVVDGKIAYNNFLHWYESSTDILVKKEIEELNYKLDQKFDEGYDDGYSDGYSEGQNYSEVEDEKERVREYRKAYDQGFEVGYERGFTNAKQMENKGC